MNVDDDVLVFWITCYKDMKDNIGYKLALVDRKNLDEARRVARQWYREAKRLRKYRDLYKGSSADVNYVKWRRAVMWSAAWKQAAKKWRDLYDIAVDDQCKARDRASQVLSQLSQEVVRAEAAEKRIKELERALTDAEQTLRNISNELIGGDLPQIAHNTAQNIFFLLNKK